MVAVMIYEIVQNYRVTGSPFAFKPFVNPMLGPAQIELITLGARWPPCMKTVEAIPLTLPIACANTTSLPATEFCSIEQICAFGGFNGQEPNQWWRCVTVLPVEYNGTMTDEMVVQKLHCHFPPCGLGSFGA